MFRASIKIYTPIPFILMLLLLHCVALQLFPAYGQEDESAVEETTDETATETATEEEQPADYQSEDESAVEEAPADNTTEEGTIDEGEEVAPEEGTDEEEPIILGQEPVVEEAPPAVQRKTPFGRWLFEQPEGLLNDTTTRSKRSSSSALAETPMAQWMQAYLRSSNGTFERVGTLALGLNFYTGDAIFTRYHLSNVGFRGALLFPVRTPLLFTYYKVQAMFHSAQIVQGGPSYTYLTATNEVMFGKNFFIRNQPFEYVPHVGLSFNNGIAVEGLSAGWKGFEVIYFWSYDFGIIVKKHIRVRRLQYAVGVLLNYERAFVADEDTKQRISFSLLLSY